MTSRDFCYWLQGFFELGRSAGELGRAGTLSETQVSMIERHLALVFKHEIDPSAGSLAVQAALNALHSPAPTIGGQGPDGTLYRC